MPKPLIVDSFAGGGGASLGIAWATGRAPDVAINHDAAAIAMHAANHPSTKHFHEDVWRVSPRKVTGGRQVGLLWASPDCRHFSRAKGGKPVSKKIRSLAWVVIKWAADPKVRPRLIMLENVREFADWGPLVPRWCCQACDWQGTEGQAVLVRKRRRCPRCESLRLKETDQLVPNPDKIGLTFRRWVGRLKALGYDVDWRHLDAADYGAPTHRKRLFVVARCDGEPIVWPEPTHCDPKKLVKGGLFTDERKPYRTAAECIDWSLPCPSIFERKKPLAEKTLRRIALGLKRYVLENPSPFIVGVGGPGYSGKPRPTDKPMHTLIQENHAAVVTPFVTPVTHSGERRSHGADEPLPTITSAQRGEFALISPILAQYYGSKSDGDCRCGTPDQPLNTVPTENRHAIVAPTLIQTGYGERAGQDPRAPGLDKPLGTVVAGGSKHAVVAAMLKHFGGVVGHEVDRPLGTVTAIDHHSLMTASIVGVGGRAGQSPPTSPEAPLGTCTAKGDKAVAACYLARFNHDDHGVPADRPLPTTTTNNHSGVCAAFLAKYNHGEKQWYGVDEPLRTVTTQGNKFGLVYAFLMKFFGSGGQWGDPGQPLGTTTAKHRFALVTVEVEPGKFEPAVAIDVPGIGPCVIADIGLRMLTPRELARAQGFPDTYELLGSKSQQVAKIGNSVCPVMAQRMVEVNWCNALSPAGAA